LTIDNDLILMYIRINNDQ